MNGTITQHTQPSYTLIPVIPGKQVHIKTKEEQVVKHYDELIIAIMKVMDIQYITHCIDKQYWLITIHRLGDILIHIVLSKTLKKQLLKQKNKARSIKTRVNRIQQASLLPNGT